MKRKIYFLAAVSLAIVLPLIFGLIYFNDLYKEKLDKINLAKVSSKPEILYESSSIIGNLEDVIIKDENYDSASYFDFQVIFTDSLKFSKNYSLYLTDIDFSNNINAENFKWRLFILDDKSGDYKQISNGNFGYGLSSFKISPNLTIGLNSVQSFRLYYYLTLNQANTLGYAGSTFEAKIKVE